MVELLTSILRLTVWLALLAAVFAPLEQIFALRPARMWRAQTGVDLAWYFINSLLPAAIIAAPLAALAQVSQRADGLGFYTAVQSLPFWARLLAAFVVNDLGAYWMHRWQHRSAFLWRFHAIHHSSEHVDWLVNTRGHPVDIVLVRLAGLTPVYLLGLAPAGAAANDPLALWVAVIGTVWSFLIHANVRWRFGPLEHLVATPAFHHWHHTKQEHRDRNFAAVFPWIDRAFGTLHLPASHPVAYGIVSPAPTTLVGQLLEPCSPTRPASSDRAAEV